MNIGEIDNAFRDEEQSRQYAGCAMPAMPEYPDFVKRWLNMGIPLETIEKRAAEIINNVLKEDFV